MSSLASQLFIHRDSDLDQVRRMLCRVASSAINGRVLPQHRVTTVISNTGQQRVEGRSGRRCAHLCVSVVYDERWPRVHLLQLPDTPAMRRRSCVEFTNNWRLSAACGTNRAIQI
eukprot:4454898-Pleurochrysis_carterae.AAC.3